ncbi:MAG: phosphoribosylanthranilate isomerase [Marinibacterium sp.]
MTRDVRIKFCGLTRPEDLDAAARARAGYVGLMFFDPSPRNLSVAQARALALDAPEGLAKVAVTVNAGDDVLDRIVGDVPLDMLQLHGAESPDRVAAVKARYGLPVMKAVAVAEEDDLPALDEYARVADQILVEAKPPRGAVLPGGNGVPFDWRLIAGRRWAVPWMLAGGLTPDNVGEAIRLTGARQVDVSSGVESAPGDKDSGRMQAFAAAAACA